MKAKDAVQQAAAVVRMQASLPAGSQTTTEAYVTSLEDLPPPCLQTLVRQHLDHRARLHMFRASKGLAAVVLQHAACCTLTLQHPEVYRGGWRATDVRKAALKGVMAGATVSLRVVLKGGDLFSCSPPSPLWSSLPLSQITHLTLERLQLSNDIVRSLQLQQCSQLQHLKMAEYQWTLDSISGPRKHNHWAVARHMAQQWQEWLPPSLNSIEAGMYNHTNAPLTIQPFLTENVTTFSTWLLDDKLLGMLAELPHLTHVTATEAVDIRYNHSAKRWPWQLLEFLQSCDLSTLEKLPLQNFPRIRMHGMPYDGHKMSAEALPQSVARLAAHPGLKIVPKALAGLDLPCLRITKDDPLELVQVCLARVETRPCALYLHEGYGLKLSDVSTRNFLVGQLQQLPDHVTAVVFYTLDYIRYPSSAGECKELWTPILAALPKHVTQTVLHMEDRPSVPVAEGLVEALTAHEPRAAVKVMIQLYESLHRESERDRNEYKQVLWELHDLAGVYPEIMSVNAVPMP